MRALSLQEKKIVAGGKSSKSDKPSIAVNDIPTLPPVVVTPPDSFGGGYDGGGGAYGGPHGGPPPNVAAYVSFLMADAYLNNYFDMEFIQNHEQINPNKILEGNIPDPKNSNSGVTINGVDLGSFTKDSFLKMADDSGFTQLDPQFVNELLPYVGPEGKDFFYQHPLKLDEKYRQDVIWLSDNTYLNIIQDFDKKLPPGHQLEDLPKPAATAIADLVIQYGPNTDRYPNFFHDIERADWTKAIAELKDFNDRYECRREDEAKLLESAHLQDGQW